jgi:hypothetical protein
MWNQLQRRLEALEQRFSTGKQPGKTLLPAWLAAEYRDQGFSFDHVGRPNV